MISRELVAPSEIGAKLNSIWENLGKEKKNRASLFNLIIYASLDARGDFIRNLVQKVVIKFPCRVFFISKDPDSSKEFLSTAVSVISNEVQTDHFACDFIEIGVGEKNLATVPYLILPHILSDLPVYLLWGEDPIKSSPIFDSLSAMANRIIFDSESTDNLPQFAKKLFSMKASFSKDIADLNWARIEPFRDVIASQFCKQDRLKDLEKIVRLRVEFNNIESKVFIHPEVQSLYLALWICQRLGFSVEKIESKAKTTSISASKKGKSFEVELLPIPCKTFSPGSITLVQIETQGNSYVLKRKEQTPEKIWVEISSQQKCEMPTSYLIEKQSSGFSLIKEISYKGSSTHFLQMLQQVEKIPS